MAAATYGFPALWTAASLGRTEDVLQLLAGGADIEEPGGDRQSTPCAAAALQGHVQTVQLLLQHKAQVSAKDNEWDTPLHYTALHGHVEIVKLLLHNGAADRPTAAGSGRTPLFYAAIQGHQDIAFLLLDKGFEVSAKDTDGRTSLHFAALKGNERMVQLLLDNGAEVSTKAKTDGGTPLHWAALEGCERVVKLLIDKGADMLARDKDGNTPADLAARSYPQIVAMLKAETDRRAKSAFVTGQLGFLDTESSGVELSIKVGGVRLELD
jgi:ankyrin repeat protein